MANPLLLRASPEHLAERRQVIEIVEKISTFQELAAIVDTDLQALPAAKTPRGWRDSPVNISLQFGWADARLKLPLVVGALAARVDAVCQRCLEPCKLPISVPVSLLLMQDDGAGAGDTGYEVWELGEDVVRPLDLVEELLIMALPMVALHESRDECGPLARQVGDGGDGTVRPFADLKGRIGQTE